MSESLETFIAQERTSLDSCANEALHRSHAIQRCGALAAFRASDGALVAYSENLMQLLTIEPRVLIGATADDVLPGLASAIGFAPVGLQPSHSILALHPALVRNGQVLDAIHHRHDGLDIVEFAPCAQLAASELRVRLRYVMGANHRIVRAKTFEDALTVCVEAARALTGFARVKIYEFLPDWSGKVIAEARAQHMPSYLGLCFPESDIPRQARYLYELLPFRSCAETGDNNARLSVDRTVGEIDLTWSVLRSVSPMHTAYLRNIGVESSFSVGIRKDGKLWGLIACHNDRPGFLPYDLWSLMADLGETLMARLHQADLQERSEKINDMRRIEAGIAKALRHSNSINITLATYAPTLRKFLNSDGFAMKYGSDIVTDGAVPPIEFIEHLLNAADTGEVGSYFATSTLHETMPEAEAHLDTACGVLIQPVKLSSSATLVWFRGPMKGKTLWAGDPDSAKVTEVRTDGTHVLGPRNSFAAWEREHARVALPWRFAEIEAAQKLFQEILDLLAYQSIAIKQLEDAYRDLSVFAHATVHDIRAPLRTISYALNMVSDAADGVHEGDDESRRKRMLELASLSSERLRGLAGQVLTFLKVSGERVVHQPVSLDEVVNDVAALLAGTMEEASAELVVDAPLDRVSGSREMLTTLLLNLVNNAIAYRASGRAPRIEIATTVRGDQVLLSVADNGEGIPPTMADRVFEPFQRLHHDDEVPGTGIGLTTCRRVAELHGGTIHVDTDFTGGTRMLVLLPGVVELADAAS